MTNYEYVQEQKAKSAQLKEEYASLWEAKDYAGAAKVQKKYTKIDADIKALNDKITKKNMVNGEELDKLWNAKHREPGKTAAKVLGTAAVIGVAGAVAFNLMGNDNPDNPTPNPNPNPNPSITNDEPKPVKVTTKIDDGKTFVTEGYEFTVTQKDRESVEDKLANDKAGTTYVTGVKERASLEKMKDVIKYVAECVKVAQKTGVIAEQQGAVSYADGFEQLTGSANANTRAFKKGQPYVSVGKFTFKDKKTGKIIENGTTFARSVGEAASMLESKGIDLSNAIAGALFVKPEYYDDYMKATKNNTVDPKAKDAKGNYVGAEFASGWIDVEQTVKAADQGSVIMIADVQRVKENDTVIYEQIGRVEDMVAGDSDLTR